MDTSKIILEEIRRLRADIEVSNKALLTVSEAASYLGIAEKTIRNSLGPRAAKKFPVNPVRLAGRVLFRKTDLDRLVESLGHCDG